MEKNSTLESHLNGSSFVMCAMDSSGQRLAKLIAFVVLLVVALVGNCLVCLIVYNNTNLRTTINYLLVNMAVSDLVIPILAATRSIVNISTGSEEWRVKGGVGEFLCKSFFFVCDMSPIVSILSLVLISFDRFSAIVLPFMSASYPSTYRKCFIALTWIIAVVFCSPYLYILGLDPSAQYCQMNWQPTTQRIYTVLLTVLFIIIPFSLLIVMHTCILYKMKMRPRDLNQTERGKRRRQISKRNITLLSFAVVLMFAVCWGPYFTVLMLANFKWDWQFDYCSFTHFVFTVQYLAYSNAAINPLLYFLFLKNFRAGLQKMFTDSICLRGMAFGRRKREKTFFDNSTYKSQKWQHLH
ncbi:hypothetical protein QZH41_005251 [Actinostola sp. cb2023]|nr:hypothetical protein QZH41_005251 [Actinostola sp. cb2023]